MSTNEDPRITEARRLMIEVTMEERQKKKNELNNLICECGHRHIEHTKSLSINYTAGFCMVENCKCQNFLMK